MMVCPTCGVGDKIIYDQTRAQFICSIDGTVIAENVVDTGPEWREFDSSDRDKKGRAGSPFTNRVHDGGITTIIGRSARMKDKVKLMKLQRWQSKLRVAARDKKVVTYLSTLNSEAAKLNLPEHVKETAAMIIKKLIETGLARRVDMYALIAATLYYASQVNNFPIYIQEIRKIYSLDTSTLWKALERVQAVAKNTQNMKSKLKPVEHIPKIVNRLNLPQQVGTKSAELVDLMFNTGLTSGKGYLALSAAMVYLISSLMDVKKTQKEVAEALQITEVTIRNRYKEIVSNFEIEVSI
ncbi:transcription initiation factor TFIIIB, Brf1 subunit/transcription initiation factor TFIIB [Metallosphaera yellowstonensis MK1]|jgi:transcription initiation factor TFIIB|uniref:Transcription initiation factor TFIIIB, Brf1 subunit/transcription initiation factor TFIIB n=2 Tax=Metallosphaera TaxID=41980 RepID=H2C8G7_9CREN|nr:transcription initiation factor TFIIIB, Brf1 subunit/transcription initiation factor TFIIB [Metallosphaera yellowstonensis MK1]